MPSGVKADKQREPFLSLSCSPAHCRRSLQPPHPEVYADGGYEGSGQEGPIFELDQETGFADTRVSQKHHLGDGAEAVNGNWGGEGVFWDSREGCLKEGQTRREG